MKFNAGILAAGAVFLARSGVMAQYDDATQYLGPDPNGCNWKTALICASSLVGCGAACAGAIVEAGVNPFADAGCAACVGASAGTCAMCWNVIQPNGQNEVCYASENYPPQYIAYEGCTVAPVETSKRDARIKRSRISA